MSHVGDWGVPMCAVVTQLIDEKDDYPGFSSPISDILARRVSLICPSELRYTKISLVA